MNKLYKVTVRLRDQSVYEVDIEAPNETLAKAFAEEAMVRKDEDKFGAKPDREEMIEYIYDSLFEIEEFLETSESDLITMIRSCHLIDYRLISCPYDPYVIEAEAIDCVEVK